MTGILRLPSSDGPYRVDRVRVSVRDVTELDGPAATVAEQELGAAEVPESGADVPFELDVELDPRRTYSVRGHAGRSDSPHVEAGDFVSTSAHLIGPTARSEIVVSLDPVGD